MRTPQQVRPAAVNIQLTMSTVLILTYTSLSFYQGSNRVVIPTVKIANIAVKNKLKVSQVDTAPHATVDLPFAGRVSSKYTT